MFGRKKRRDDDIIGPSTGVMKWVNKFFRFVLYPFIHPVWFISFVVVAAIVLIGWPSFNGVEFAQIPEWYKQRVEKHYNEAETIIDSKVQMLMDKGKAEMQKITGTDENVKVIVQSPRKTELVAYEAPKASSRKVFGQATDAPVMVKNTFENVERPKDEVYFKRNDALKLNYLNVPEKISGKVSVVSANELIVDGKLVFFYGIYAATKTSKGIAAKKYLRETIEGKDIECLVGAYAADGTATAICFHESINLNQKMVELGYSRDVGLN